MKSSYWGKVQDTRTYGRGIHFVSTAGHGGFLISKSVAEKRLSEAARKAGDRYGNYYAYEEDCAYHIVTLELPETRNERYDEASTIKSLSSVHPEYLIERGITPDPEAYARYKEWQEYFQRHAAKDPNLVVAAVGEDDGTVKVWTADNKEHFVTAESYDKRSPRTGVSLLTLALVQKE